MAVATKSKTKAKSPIPIRWQQIINLLPQHDWVISRAAREVGYSERYINTNLPVALRKDDRFNEALSRKRAEIDAKTAADPAQEAAVFDALRDEAKEAGQYSAAVRAQEQKCRLLGLYNIDNSQRAAGNLASALGTMLRLEAGRDSTHICNNTYKTKAIEGKVIDSPSIPADKQGQEGGA